MQAHPEGMTPREGDGGQDEEGGQGEEQAAPAVGPETESGEDEAHEEQKAHRARSPEQRKRDEADHEAARHAARDVRRLQHARLPSAGRGIVLHRLLQDRERDAHEDGGRAEEDQGQHHVELHERVPVHRAAEVERSRPAPELVVPLVVRSAGRETREEGEDGARVQEEDALQDEESPQRPPYPADHRDAGQRARSRPEQVHRQQRAERVGCGLERDVQDPEPEDLQRQRAEPAQGVESEPHPERSRRLVGAGRRVRCRSLLRLRALPPRRSRPPLPERQAQRTGARGDIRGHRGQDRGAYPVVADEDPRRPQRARGRSEHVDPVQEPDRLARRGRVAHHRASQERQRHPHQDRGQGEARELQEAGAQGLTVDPSPAHVEPVVVERAAHRTERRDRELAGREESERARTRDAGAHHRTQMAPEPETEHERGDDHRDREKTDSRLQGEDALPGHLVREGGRAAEEKRDTDDGQAGIAERRGHEPPILPCALRNLAQRPSF